MSAENFNAALLRTKNLATDWEVGGNRYGISQKTWEIWLRNPASFKYGKLPESVADIAWNMAVPIYKTLYWDACRCDEIADSDLAARVFDFAVNMGSGRAVKALQQAYNRIKPEDWQELREDGIIGAITLQAVNRASSRYADAMLASFNYSRARYYESIIQNSPSQRAFIRGWFSRCV